MLRISSAITTFFLERIQNSWQQPDFPTRAVMRYVVENWRDVLVRTTLLTHSATFWFLRSCKDLYLALNQYLNPKKFKHGLSFSFRRIYPLEVDLHLPPVPFPQKDYTSSFTLFLFTLVYSLFLFSSFLLYPGVFSLDIVGLCQQIDILKSWFDLIFGRVYTCPRN